ncbi:MAG: LPS export ABC transporter permease LptF [Nitrospinales bacterium]
MKTIDRYIFWELLKIFIISVGVLTTILFLDKILFLTELIINKGVSFIEVVRMMVYISPAFLALTIPMSVLVASVAAFNQLSGENELVAMKASGWSFMKILRPVLIFSVMTYIITNFIMFFALPWGNQSFKQIIYDIVQNRAHFDIRPNVFNRDFDRLLLFVGEKEDENSMKNIFIADTLASDVPKIILAEEGTILSNPEILKIQLKLKNGTIHDLSEKRKHYQILNFDRYDLNLDLPRRQDLQKRLAKGNRELSFGELAAKIERLKKAGKKAFKEEVEISKKFSIPFTCLLFGFVGAPLGVKSSRSGRSGGFVISLIVILVYYMGLISMQNLGSVGKVHPLLSVWAPNVLLAAVAAYLIYKTHKEIPFRMINWVEDGFIITYEVLRRWYLRWFVKSESTTSAHIVGKAQRNIDEAARTILKSKMQKIETGKLPRRT